MSGKQGADYWFELRDQCDVALDAVGRLNYDLVRFCRHPLSTADQERLREEVFETINLFLSVANRISEMVCLKKGSIAIRQKPRLSLPGMDAEVKQAKALQKRLSEEAKRILKDRRLQDHHLKTQQPLIGKPCEKGNYGFIGSRLLYPAPFTASAPYSYDPISRKFQYQGEVFDIQEIAGAIYDLKRILKDMSEEQGAVRQPVTCSVAVPLVIGA